MRQLFVGVFRGDEGLLIREFGRSTYIPWSRLVRVDLRPPTAPRWSEPTLWIVIKGPEIETSVRQGNGSLALAAPRRRRGNSLIFSDRRLPIKPRRPESEACRRVRGEALCGAARAGRTLYDSTRPTDPPAAADEEISMARSWRVLSVSVLIAATLTGCEPADVPNIAVTLDPDGTPVVLAIACPGATVDYISLYENRATARSGSSAAWTITMSAKPDGESPQSPSGPGAVLFPLLRVPAGWEVLADGITVLRDDQLYGLRVSVGIRDSAVASFTLSDLGTLKAGQVWRGTNGKQAMSRVAFEKSADTSCH